MMIPVNLSDKSYEIHIAEGLGERFIKCLSSLGLSKHAVLITHPNLLDLYGNSLVKDLEQAGYSIQVLTVPEGESSKNMNEAALLYPKLLDAGLDRQSFIIALGGGVIGDLAGFVAGTYMRGIPFIQVPTSLLAQVDASIGGKVAVDLAKGKNLVGLFYQPKMVFIDVNTLITLSKDQMQSGMAEVIKYGCILDPELFDFLESHQKEIDQNKILIHIIERSCQAKASVVSQDEKESGLRAILNYGHTIGHAIEAALGYQNITHGQAISIGMRAASIISYRLGHTSESVVQKQENLFRLYGLSQNYSRPNPEEIETYLWSDKKQSAGKLNWILLKNIGKVFMSDQVPIELVREVLGELFGD